jgi:hypothetical protein
VPYSRSLTTSSAALLSRRTDGSLGAFQRHRETEKAQRILADWIGVYSDEAKRVIGFWGLTIAKDTVLCFEYSLDS